jgi:hypothetical protein
MAATGRMLKIMPCSPVREQNELGARKLTLRNSESALGKVCLNAACKMEEIT